MPLGAGRGNGGEGIRGNGGVLCRSPVADDERGTRNLSSFVNFHAAPTIPAVWWVSV